MGLVRAIFATTHVDSHGDQLTKEALEDMVTQSRSKHIRVTPEHDPRTPPIGRVVHSKHVELDDGDHGAESTLEHVGAVLAAALRYRPA